MSAGDFSVADIDGRSNTRLKEIIWWMIVASLLFWGFLTVKDWRWEVLEGTGPFLVYALGVSWFLAIVSISLGLIFAVPLALGRTYGRFGLNYFCVGVIEFIRGIPDLLVIFWSYMALPLLLGLNISNWWAGIVALTALASVNLAEVIRGGIYSVDTEQIDAGRATGLGSRQVFFYIVLPQAVKNMVPAMLGQLVSIFKTTTLVYVIGLVEFFRAVTQINSAVVAPYPLYLMMSIVYFISCFSLSWGVRRLDQRS